MSLLGRLEDLSLPDIIQIVYLSRRTGVLEIVDDGDRWGIMFLNGLIAGGFAPGDQTILDYLRASGVISEENAANVEQDIDAGSVAGDAILQRDLVHPNDLADLIKARVTAIVRPLLSRRTGEFNFILSDSISSTSLGYDVEALFRQGGILPTEILEEGEKAKPLQNLEESMRAGKALLRGDKGGEAFGFGEEIEQMSTRSRAAIDPGHASPADEEDGEGFAELPDSEDPFTDGDETVFSELDLQPDEDHDPLELGDDPGSEEDLFGAPDPDGGSEDLADLLSSEPGVGFDEIPSSTGPTAAGVTRGADAPIENAEPSPNAREGAASRVPASPAAADGPVGSLKAPPQTRPSSRFRIEGDRELQIEDRNVVLFERNPMLRVAAKRAFGQNDFQIFQFGHIDEVREVIHEMLEKNRFFVSFLDLTQGEEEETKALLHLIKRRNRHLPVVVIDVVSSLERRHELVKLGADMYLTKPDPSRLQPAIADQSLRLFADELVQFSDHAIRNWERLTETFSEAEGSVGATLYEIAEKERMNRTRTLMRSLINELADPDDITQVSQTILRLADEYLDRAALFAASPTRFLGLGGFGPTGGAGDMTQNVRRIRIARDADSVLRDVTVSGVPHRGKMRRTAANVKLLTGLGSVQPTEIIAIPIVNDGAPVGVLYGDNGGQRTRIGKTSGLEIFLEQAGLALHNAVITNARRKGLDWESR